VQELDIELILWTIRGFFRCQQMWAVQQSNRCAMLGVARPTPSTVRSNDFKLPSSRGGMKKSQSMEKRGMPNRRIGLAADKKIAHAGSVELLQQLIHERQRFLESFVEASPLSSGSSPRECGTFARETVEGADRAAMRPHAGGTPTDATWHCNRPRFSSLKAKCCP
jgi:hypothetical protein